MHKGGLLVSDEIDNNFHPSLLKKLISLFQNPKVSKANAQLLFTSHDTNLMDRDCMRDQFYFAEKTDLLDTKILVVQFLMVKLFILLIFYKKGL
ncbi:AAA family ATPase [Chitinophaga sp. LS1]|uniref:AAA family ATPase n=1 Tax=Chitinophaga sp. LS1 TaxID=3051176 RepID=UPI0039F054D7